MDNSTTSNIIGLGKVILKMTLDKEVPLIDMFHVSTSEKKCNIWIDSCHSWFQASVFNKFVLIKNG